MSQMELLRKLLSQLAEFREATTEISGDTYWPIEDDLNYHLKKLEAMLSKQLWRMERNKLAEMRQEITEGEAGK